MGILYAIEDIQEHPTESLIWTTDKGERS